MKLSQALKAISQPTAPGAPTFDVALACSFTPLHLQTFLSAWLITRQPERAIDLRTGQYGDLLGSIERFAATGADAAVVVLEWSDFDGRLGLRQMSGWHPGDLADILQTVRQRAEEIGAGVLRLAEGMPIVVSLPTLPIPPMSHAPGWQASRWALELRHEAGRLACRLAASPRVRLLDPQRLDQESPLAGRLDLRSEYLSGFPYRMEHASTLAEQLSKLLLPPPPKKGLITDLDDTFWSGIVGDDGVDVVSWSLEEKSLRHGLYQQLLNSLSEAGVLVAVASKNDPEVVERAFRRRDLVCPADKLFPVEVHWGPKSESVGRILQAWNIAADSVVFIDDNLMELAEVAAAFPELQTLQFPRQDDNGVLELLVRVRDLFGKPVLTEEDALRQQSLRRRADPSGAAAAGGVPADEFLRQAGAEIELHWGKSANDPRALELVNKTNQFNLNGRRYSEGEWLACLRDPASELLIVSYRDKFGPLGKIAVLMGSRHGRSFRVGSWVLSCRAFARRVEHRCLERLFDKFDIDELVFDFAATPRNGPLQEALAGLLGGPAGADARLTREQFEARCPALFHQVSEAAHE